MSNMEEVWKKEKLAYQQRYFEYYKKWKQNPRDKDSLGHLHECSYVLINIFGLTQKQVEELEKHNGFTNSDIDKE